MFAIQVAGSPFDDRILLELEADDGTFQHIYVSAYSDEIAVVVYENRNTWGRPLREQFAGLKACGSFGERTVSIVDDQE